MAANFSKNDLELYEEIARGGFGYVRRAEDKRNGLELAVKCFINNIDSRRLMREADKLEELKHESIVRIYGKVETDEFVGVAMEYMAGGSIAQAKESLRKAQKSLPVEIMNQWNYEIAKGIEHIHKNGKVHKDIKARNCLIDAHFHAKICDFEECRGSQTSTQTRDILKGARATLTHQCPQCINDIEHASKYAPGCDIYAFGILMFEVYSKNTLAWPIDIGEGLLNNAIIRGERPNIKDIENVAPPEIISLMERCWAQKPADRPIAEVIVRELYEVFKPQQDKAKQEAIILTPHVLRKKETDKMGMPVNQVTARFLQDGLCRVTPISNDPADRVWKHLSTEEAEEFLNLKRHGIDLKKEERAVVSDDCINAIGKQIGPHDFKNIGRCFLFTDPELDGFHHDYQNQGGISEVNTRMLKRWKEARDSDATYKWLATACLSLSRNDLINLIIKMPA